MQSWDISQKLSEIEQLNIWRRIFYQISKFIPASTQNFMLSCTVKCFSEYSILLAYPTMHAHAWHNIALLQFWKWELGGLVHFNILRLLNSKSDINALENIYNGSLEVFEKIEPTPLRLNPLYIKVQFKRLKFSYKDNRHFIPQVYLIYMNFIIHGIIPFITLIVMNISIYKKVRVQNCNAPNMTAWLDSGKWCKSLVVMTRKRRQSLNIILLRPASRPRHGSLCAVSQMPA